MGGRLSPRVGIGVSIVLVAVAIVLASTGGGEDDGGAQADTAPRILDVAGLVELEESLDHSLYWAGEQPPDQVEVTQEADGNVYLRYLPPGVEAGDPREQFLTVGTYSVADPVGSLRSVAAEEGGELERLADGGFVLVNPSSEGSAYLAHPGSELQIEVYDPAPGRALGLIRSGAIEPVG